MRHSCQHPTLCHGVLDLRKTNIIVWRKAESTHETTENFTWFRSCILFLHKTFIAKSLPSPCSHIIFVVCKWMKFINIQQTKCTGQRAGYEMLLLHAKKGWLLDLASDDENFSKGAFPNRFDNIKVLDCHLPGSCAARFHNFRGWRWACRLSSDAFNQPEPTWNHICAVQQKFGQINAVQNITTWIIKRGDGWPQPLFKSGTSTSKQTNNMSRWLRQLRS